MATLKQRLHRKNSSNTYDTVHLESSSDLILRPSGRTVEQDLADYLPEVQANDNVPQSLLFGTDYPSQDGVSGRFFRIPGCHTSRMILIENRLRLEVA